MRKNESMFLHRTSIQLFMTHLTVLYNYIIYNTFPSPWVSTYLPYPMGPLEILSNIQYLPNPVGPPFSCNQILSHQLYQKYENLYVKLKFNYNYISPLKVLYKSSMTLNKCILSMIHDHPQKVLKCILLDLFSNFHCLLHVSIK